MTLTRVPIGPGYDGDIAACKDHAAPTRAGAMLHTMGQARAMAAGWIDRNRRGKVPAAVFALGILWDRPDCCPSGCLAQSCVMAAFRELTAGEG